MVTSPWLGLLEISSGISSTTDTLFASSAVSLSHYQTQYLRLHDSAFRNEVVVYPLNQWSSTWGTRRHLTSIKTEHRNRLNFEPDLILALTKIRFSTLTSNNCQKYHTHTGSLWTEQKINIKYFLISTWNVLVFLNLLLRLQPLKNTLGTTQTVLKCTRIELRQAKELKIEYVVDKSLKCVICLIEHFDAISIYMHKFYVRKLKQFLAIL
jgi:hypothetical protein